MQTVDWMCESSWRYDVATVGQYLAQLQQAGVKMAGQMGVDVTQSMKGDRVVAAPRSASWPS